MIFSFLLINVKGGITRVTWTVYSKIKTISKSDGTTITYGYDPAGNRISKAVTANNITVTTWYVRDAQGNTLAVYNENAGTLKLTEQDIYGSSRLSIWNRNIDADQVWDQIVTTATRGNKNYELTNHLGNVLVTLSDVRKQVVKNNVITGYTPVVVSASDYYSFGMQAPGRTFSTASYRFSINGQEKETELNENITTAQFWEYDSRIGRRWNVDPVVRASQSPYVCFNDNPVTFADPSGLDGVAKQHAVEKGDNLSRLAKKYSTTVDDLLKWNPGIKDKNKIFKGETINVSDPGKDLLVGVVKFGLGEGEDAKSSVGALPPGAKTDENANIPNSVLERLHSSVSAVATLSKRNDKDWVEAEDNIYKQFYSGSGGINTKTYGIAKEMAKSKPLQDLGNQIAGTFRTQMANNNGDYSNVNMTNLFQVPTFSDVSKPLLALVGGTQQLDIYLSDIKVHGRQYTAKITFWLWDDYGVSAEDCVQSGAFRNLTPVNDALKAQWILEHNRGYKPLINGFKFIRMTSGSF